MVSDLEKAQIMYKLARKHNWGAKYDRLEHFKRRVQDLDKNIKELQKQNWIITHAKTFEAISLNPKYKKEIIEYIEKYLPDFKGYVR